MKILQDFDKLFIDKLNIYLAQKREAYSLVHKDATKLIDILSEFMNRKSKHIRPAIFYFSFMNWKKDAGKDAMWSIALSIEFVHALALIHDDIIDRSSLRRGKPTIHELYGVETAILLGDLALTIADEVYLDGVTHLGGIDLNQKKAFNSTFNTLKQETLIGEYLDVMKNDDILTVMKLKTAQYTFEKPAVMGMLLAGATQKEIDIWSHILLDIGVTFQIHDDFIGSFGNESVTGKPTDSDIKEGKNTIFAALFLERAHESDKNHFHSFFGSQTASHADLAWFQLKSEEYGITTTVRHDIESRIKRIRAQIAQIQSSKTDFNLLIDGILDKISDFSFLPMDSSVLSTRHLT